MMLRPAVATVAIVLALTGCAADPIDASAPPEDQERLAAVYVAMLRTLVAGEEDSRRRGGGPALTAVYVLDAAYANAANPRGASGTDGLPISVSAQQKVVAALSDLPPTRFVAARDDVIDSPDPLGRVRGDDILITLGTVPRTGDRLEVAINGWVSGLNAHWRTYKVERRDSGWAVTGTTGGYAVA